MESSLTLHATPSKVDTKAALPIPFGDHIRAQFESLRRRPELASDLNCFRPGEALSSIRYIAHPHGLHVARWLKVLSHTQTAVDIDTANPVPAFSNGFVSARPALPQWLRIPMILRYALSGLALRFSRSRRSTSVIHAHCASGNGLVAWLSGQRYLIGTYGSEIYGATQRGRIYCWLMKRILRGAERISVGSTESTAILAQQFGIPPERIYFFHLGYDDECFRPLDHSERMQLRRDRQLPVDEPIWVVNRRTDPHYRTQDVVQGFLGYCQSGGRGRLILLCGDHQREYTRAICEMIRSHAAGDRIVVVDQMLSSQELASWLQLGDFSISVPRTDNFSISTLESIGCGTVPILADLEGYHLLRPCKPVRWMTQFEAADFTTMFTDTATSWPKPHDAHRTECFRFAKDGFSTEGAIRSIAAFYLGHPLEQAASIRRVA